MLQFSDRPRRRPRRPRRRQPEVVDLDLPDDLLQALDLQGPLQAHRDGAGVYLIALPGDLWRMTPPTHAGAGSWLSGHVRQRLELLLHRRWQRESFRTREEYA